MIEMNLTENFTDVFNKTTTTTILPSFSGQGCNTKPTGANLANAIFIIIVMILTVVGNTFVCLTIVVCRQLRRHITYYFVFFLAVSDIAVGMFVFPFRIYMSLHNQNFCAGIGLCVFYVIIDTTSSIASVTNLFVIALDRYFVINCPYRYPTWMNRRKAIGICIGVWIYSHLWSWASSFTWDKNRNFSISHSNHRCTNTNKNFYTPFIFLVYFIPLTTMGIIYMSIWRIARKQAQDIQKYQVRNEERSQRKQNRERKATATLAIIYGAFVICWLPNCILGLASTLASKYFMELGKKNEQLVMFLQVAFVLVLPPLNSTMNPFIYAIHNHQFRNALRNFITKKKAALLLDSENGQTKITFLKRSTKSQFKLANLQKSTNYKVQNGEQDSLHHEAQL